MYIKLVKTGTDGTRIKTKKLYNVATLILCNCAITYHVILETVGALSFPDRGSPIYCWVLTMSYFQSNKAWKLIAEEMETYCSLSLNVIT
jgi:hypothetical protein